MENARRFRGQLAEYAVDARIDAGGMAEVFRGHPVGRPAELLAIKVPLAGTTPSDEAVFLREAMAAQRVHAPNVVRVVDWGPGPFIAFAFVNGPTLRSVIVERRAARQHWSEAELIDLYRQLATAMKAINAHVVHRDLKPANIFVEGGRIKIGDFGIAKLAGDATRTRTFKGWGTPTYMAPETFRSETADWRSDQYSLGVVFHELAMLAPPFTGTPEELERLHLYARPARVAGGDPPRSDRLVTVVSRMLEKRAADRFPSWDALLDALDKVEAHRVEPPEPRLAALAQLAARHEDAAVQKGLAEERAQAELRAERDRRVALVEYWATELFATLDSHVREVNAALTQHRLRYRVGSVRPPDGSGRHVCAVGFMNAELHIALEIVPPPDTEVLAWGTVSLVSNHRLWFSNLYLVPTDDPYGAWREVDLEMNPIVRQGVGPGDEDRQGGNYEVRGRIVLATNWAALRYQRERRNTMSVVQYSEHPLDWTERCHSLLQQLVEEGPKEKSR